MVDPARHGGGVLGLRAGAGPGPRSGRPVRQPGADRLVQGAWPKDGGWMMANDESQMVMKPWLNNSSWVWESDNSPLAFVDNVRASWAVHHMIKVQFMMIYGIQLIVDTDGSWWLIALDVGLLNEGESWFIMRNDGNDRWSMMVG